MPGGSKQHNRDLAAVALAAGQTGAEAAAAASVVERTVRAWNSEFAFRARVRELRDQMVQRAAASLADSMTEAATVLRELLKSEDEDVRHRAAVKVLDLGVKVGEVADLQARVAELERQRDEPQGADEPTGGGEPESGDVGGECEPAGDLPDQPSHVDG